MLIVFHHLSELINWRPVGLGGFGVTFFLVLSGFVLPLGYRRLTAWSDVLRFLWNRIIRIYPLHIVLLAIALVPYWYWKAPLDHEALILNIFLVQSWIGPEEIYFSYNSVSWFLSTLLFCYVVFAVILQRPRELFWLFFSISVLVITATIYVVDYLRHVSADQVVYWLYIFPPNRLFNFLSGVGASFIFVSLYPKAKERLGVTSATVIELIAIVLLLDRVVYQRFSRYFCDLVLSQAPGLDSTIWSLVDHYGFSTFLTVGILFVFGFQKGFFSKMLSKKLFLFFGEISFAIFLSHELIFRYLAFKREWLVTTFGDVLVGAGACLLVFIVSYFLYTWVEKPLGRATVPVEKPYSGPADPPDEKGKPCMLSCGR